MIYGKSDEEDDCRSEGSMGMGGDQVLEKEMIVMMMIQVKMNVTTSFQL